MYICTCCMCKCTRHSIHKIGWANWHRSQFGTQQDSENKFGTKMHAHKQYIEFHKEASTNQIIRNGHVSHPIWKWYRRFREGMQKSALWINCNLHKQKTLPTEENRCKLKYYMEMSTFISCLVINCSSNLGLRNSHIQNLYLLVGLVCLVCLHLLYCLPIANCRKRTLNYQDDEKEA